MPLRMIFLCLLEILRVYIENKKSKEMFETVHNLCKTTYSPVEFRSKYGQPQTKMFKMTSYTIG